MKKSTQFVKRMFALALAMTMLFALAVPAFADETEAVNAAKSGVLQIKSELRVVQDYTAEGEKILSETNATGLVWLGTGFLVNDNTVITNAHVVNEEYLLQSYFGSYYRSAYLDIFEVVITVTLSNNIDAPVTLKTQSTDMDFAILELEDSISSRSPLTLASASYLESVSTGAAVYALGFPARMFVDGDYSAFDNDSMYVLGGTISALKDVINNNITGNGKQTIVPMIVNTTDVSGGNSGGPLVMKDGVVIGITTQTALVVSTGTVVSDAYAINIGVVTTTLDDLGIEYTTTDSVVVLPTTEPTEDSDDDSSSASASSETLPTSAPTTAPIVDPEPDNTLLIVIGVVAAAVILLGIILVVIFGKGKKASTPQAPTNTGAAPAAPVMPVAPADAGDTTLLNPGAGDTTVLNSQNFGTLTRQKTGEKIVINNPRFIVGKEKGRVNYAIVGNNAISRKHIALAAKNGSVYITDQNTTNGTFVNGAKLVANQEVLLPIGAKITMGEEEFIFEM